ncbi:MAG: 4Fe-4S dicluster domain-containing protein [Elusimicrobiota bacterium]
MTELKDQLRESGVVGAGGAGFPTHVKAAATAEFVIANGAECEPLLQKDRELLKAFPAEFLDGLEKMTRAVGARQGIVAVKAKHEGVVSLYSRLLKDRPRLRLCPLGDFYPAGDEFCLVHEVTGRLIPPGGIPIQVGVVVDNVETLYNVSRADREPVTETFLTVAGAVAKPCTLRLPVGASFADAIRLAGGPKTASPVALDGGAMMGRVVEDMTEPVTKTTGGLIVLGAEHSLVRRKSAPRKQISRIGRSACDQCSFCTELCPRYLLGYPVQPHRVMRSLGMCGAEGKPLSEWSLLCCECSLCSLYSCPESLDPRNVCVAAKGDLREAGAGWKESLNAGKEPSVHPMREFRKIPLESLIKRLGLWDYQVEAPLLREPVSLAKVRIPLKQGLGSPAVPVVSVGQKVRRGQLLGEIPEGELGARVHASIDGVVKSVDRCVTIET